jgi:hypothetical protein
MSEPIEAAFVNAERRPTMSIKSMRSFADLAPVCRATASETSSPMNEGRDLATVNLIDTAARAVLRSRRRCTDSPDMAAHPQAAQPT